MNASKALKVLKPCKSLTSRYFLDLYSRIYCVLLKLLLIYDLFTDKPIDLNDIEVVHSFQPMNTIGNDCSKRSCPKGPEVAGKPNGTNIAHPNIECSGRGSCNYEDGTCSCYDGYYGNNCAKMRCLNNCSDKGACISLREAAILNDGYMFNHTTVYNQWDADLMFGCKCDPGYSGADCSLRVCPSGIDPRLSASKYEVRHMTSIRVIVCFEAVLASLMMTR